MEHTIHELNKWLELRVKATGYFNTIYNNTYLAWNFVPKDIRYSARSVSIATESYITD